MQGAEISWGSLSIMLSFHIAAREEWHKVSKEEVGKIVGWLPIHHGRPSQAQRPSPPSAARFSASALLPSPWMNCASRCYNIFLKNTTILGSTSGYYRKVVHAHGKNVKFYGAADSCVCPAKHV